MTSLADHPINRLRPAQHPDRIQLYSFPTPNGIKVSAMLEETGLPYEAHTISIMKDDQLTPEFLALNPNNKIPAIIDPDGPDGRMVTLFETGAILIYLGEKSGKFLPSDPLARGEVIQWLMWQMGGLGPMLGQFGHFFKFAAGKTSDDYARTRYTDEGRRLLRVLDGHLEGRDYVAAGEYTIADMAIWPWLRVVDFYEGHESLGTADFRNVGAYLERCLDRPASQAALSIPPRE
ncbi:MAG: glutathione S-transferase N-terminal domain-containing protein [Rubricella sp.]